MIPADELVKDIRKDLDEIEKMRGDITAKVMMLERMNRDEWDWITVKKGSEMSGLSLTTIYNMVNYGKLETRRMGAKVYVRFSSLLKMNDVDIGG